MFATIMQLVRGEIAEWRRIADFKELSKLSDHQLDDIGLRRDQLVMLEWGTVDEAQARPVSAPRFQPGFEPCG